MPASYTSGQSSYSCGHPSCWVSSQRSPTLSLARHAMDPRHLLHSALTCPSSGNAWHLQIKTPICTRRTTTHQFMWRQQQMCGALGGSPMECGVVGRHYKTPYFHPRHRHPLPWNGPAKNSVCPALLPPRRCRTFPLLLKRMGHGPFCGLWVWRRGINRRPCCPPMSNSSTSPWNARPDGSGRWDNRISAQNLPRDLVRPSSELGEVAQLTKKQQKCNDKLSDSV